MRMQTHIRLCPRHAYSRTERATLRLTSPPTLLRAVVPFSLQLAHDPSLTSLHLPDTIDGAICAPGHHKQAMSWSPRATRPISPAPAFGRLHGLGVAAPPFGLSLSAAHNPKGELGVPARHLAVPNACGRGAKPEVPHKWADWLHHPCGLGGPQCFRAPTTPPEWHWGAKYSAPQATSPRQLGIDSQRCIWSSCQPQPTPR